MSHGPRLRWRRVTFDDPNTQGPALHGGFMLEELVDRRQVMVDEGGVVQFEHDVPPYWRAVEAFGGDEERTRCAIVVRWPDTGTTLVALTELDRVTIPHEEGQDNAGS